MSTQQPKWKLVAQLGDAHPIDYGGYFVYIDETGVYAPEAELLVEPSDDEVERDDRARDTAERELAREFEKANPDADYAACDSYVAENLHTRWTSRLKWVVYRFCLEPCTYINGVLSDNKYHPDVPAWFATQYNSQRPQDGDDLKSLSESNGMTQQDVIDLFISDDICKRAHGWRMVGEHWGFDNLDSYPLTLNRAEVEARYAEELSGKQTTKENK